MAMDSTGSSAALSERAEKLSRRWLELCARYLPVAPESSVWRHSRALRASEPEQGWKLHVSATVLNAPGVLARVAPLLAGLDVPFKAPASLREVRRLNSGIRYAYSQVGKVITVYPRSDEEAGALARRLHELTRRTPAPAVPFDLCYRPGSNVYYRYGAFRSFEAESPDGARVPAMRGPSGETLPDERTREGARPDWIADPFIRQAGRAPERPAGPLGTTLRVFRALSQRGKGGVYQALDLSPRPPRLCLLKEGRRWSEMSWDGRDGRWRVRHEERVLTELRARGIDVPRVYFSFEAEGNYYLVTEFIDGESLQSYLFRRRRRLTVSRVLRHAAQLAGFMARMHAAGWAWRDCKPSNLIVTARGELRPLDFEGSCPVGVRDPSPWMTPAFSPPPGRARGGPSPEVYDDLYALGAVTYLLLTGRMPGPAPAPVSSLRRSVPPEVCALVELLLDPGAQGPPDASAVEHRLRATRALASHTLGRVHRPRPPALTKTAAPAV